jgi:UDP-N-acetylglucosamine 2-epimerase (non-hydrolysing)
MARIMMSVSDIFGLLHEEFDLVLVQGDTASAFCGALSAFHHDTPLGHVEAGLRTRNLYEPFPEEMYRRTIARMATLHFAPTRQAAENLMLEHVEGTIEMTGNPVVDELDRMLSEPAYASAKSNLLKHLGDRKLILVTCHRRENLKPRLNRLLTAICALAEARPDVLILWPLHPNPFIGETVRRYLGGDFVRSNVSVVEAMPYTYFLPAVECADLVITDSGGVVEEAITLGRTVAVIRDETERPEAIHAGGMLVTMGMMHNLAQIANDLLQWSTCCRRTTFGDGHAGERIARIILA